MNRPCLVVAAAVAFASASHAQQFTTIPLASPTQADAVPLYPDTAKAVDDEIWYRSVGTFGTLKVDERSVRNVVRPTITPVLPDPARATGAAVIVAPGGAFMALSIDHEGFEVAHWLADRGVAAFVLKYRLLKTPVDSAAFLAQIGQVFGQAAATPGKVVPTFEDPAATSDALQALRLVRAGAERWHIDPARVGMIGFSAGAMTSLQTILHARPTEMPAFAGYIYGPMTAVTVPAGAAPLFAAYALDDGLFGRTGFGLVDAWQAAGRPVEVHAYERGDHGFGMGRPGTSSTMVMPEFLAWLEARGLIRPPRSAR